MVRRATCKGGEAVNFPRKDRDTIKTAREVVAVTISEKQRIQEASKKQNITKSTYIRLAVLRQLEKDGF